MDTGDGPGIAEVIKTALKRLGRILLASLIVIAAVTVLCFAYGLIADGRFTMAYVFTGNYAVGAIAIAAGLVIHFVPAQHTARLRKSKLIDITAYKEARKEESGRKQWKGNDVLFTGIATMFIAAILELLIWFITVG